jgi:quaternary ammonium compound-resistance protein SugE
VTPEVPGSTPPFSSAVGWGILVVAGLTEIGWAIGLKYAAGFTKPWPSVVTIALMIISMGLLAQAARVLPIGTAYAVWTGIGAVGAGVLGMILFNEPKTAARIACMVLVVAGIVGLKLTTKT